MIKEYLGNEWYELLGSEFNKSYMNDLCGFVNSRREQTTVYPAKENVFNAYKLTPYSQVRVCIIGQDPYIKENQAHGLSFSIENNGFTPSLKQIEKAVYQYYTQNLSQILDWKWNNNLVKWTEQGIMLLNSVLTVDKGISNSHKGKGWEVFTTKTVELLDERGDVIFLLWGKDAQVFKHIVKNSTIIECEHPVAASYQGRDWNNNDCFNKVNQILKNKIIW